MRLSLQRREAEKLRSTHTNQARACDPGSYLQAASDAIGGTNEREKHLYCTIAGNETGKWYGQCPACGSWNTIVEAPAAAANKSKARAVKVAAAARLNRPQPNHRAGHTGGAPLFDR
jgi:hypothetical protein